MDVEPPTKRTRFWQQQKSSSPSSSKQSMFKKHWVCNELVFAICPNISARKASDRILLTARNIASYLGPRFRKKLARIYRNAIAYIRRENNCSRIMHIAIDQVAPRNERKHIVVAEDRDYCSRYMLQINQLRIRVFTWNNNYKKEYRKTCRIDAATFENPHLMCFIRLIVPMIKPTKLCLDRPIKPNTELFLNQLHHCFDWIQLRAGHFLSEKMCNVLANYNKLQITNFEREEDIGLNAWPQFCRALVQWLTTDDQPKQCIFELPFSSGQQLTILLDEVKADFSRAPVNSEFVVHFSRWNKSVRALSEFSLDNGDGEVLELRQSAKAKRSSKYTLRRFGKSDKGEKHLEEANAGDEYGSGEETAQIQLMCVQQ